MDPSQYQKLAARTECDQEAASRKHYYHDQSKGEPLLATRLTHAAMGISSEAGELCAAVERWINYGQPLDRLNIKEELGDLMWYIALACSALGLDLSDVMSSNVLKLRKRYPEKYSNFHAKEENRDREVEREAMREVLGGRQLTKEELRELDRECLRKAANVEMNPSGSVRLRRCPECRTPFSDRRPETCPECGFPLKAQTSQISSVPTQPME